MPGVWAFMESQDPLQTMERLILIGSVSSRAQFTAAFFYISVGFRPGGIAAPMESNPHALLRIKKQTTSSCSKRNSKPAPGFLKKV